MDGVAALRRAVLMAFCGLFIATTVGAEPQDDPPQDDQLQADQPQIARPNPQAESGGPSRRWRSYAINCAIK